MGVPQHKVNRRILHTIDATYEKKQKICCLLADFVSATYLEGLPFASVDVDFVGAARAQPTFYVGVGANAKGLLAVADFKLGMSCGFHSVSEELLFNKKKV